MASPQKAKQELLPGLAEPEPRTLPLDPGFEDLPPCRYEGEEADSLAMLRELESRWVGPTGPLITLMGNVDSLLRETEFLTEGKPVSLTAKESAKLSYHHSVLTDSLEHVIAQLEERREQVVEHTWSATPLPREGISAYTVLIRDPSDPKRQPRTKDGDKAPHRTLNQSSAEEWKAGILDALARRPESTLNAISVLLLDKTADIVFGTTFFSAFEELLSEGKIEHTMEAPILWRAIGEEVQSLSGK